MNPLKSKQEGLDGDGQQDGNDDGDALVSLFPMPTETLAVVKLEAGTTRCAVHLCATTDALNGNATVVVRATSNPEPRKGVHFIRWIGPFRVGNDWHHFTRCDNRFAVNMVELGRRSAT